MDVAASESTICPGCGRVVDARARRCGGCGRLAPGLWGQGPRLSELGRRLRFAPLVVWGAGALYVLSLVLAPASVWQIPEQIRRGELLWLLAPAGEPLYLLGMSGRVPIFEAGRWWTPLSAAWLHGSLLHVVFNLLWIRHLVPDVARRFGAARGVVIYTAGSIAGFFATSLAALAPLPQWLGGADFTVGASAPLFGLFGALTLYGQRSGDRPLSREYLGYAGFWIVLGVVLGAGGENAVRIDNWAHLGGFAGGYFAAWALDPDRREEPLDVAAALGCLAATVAAILASVVHALGVVT